MRSLFEFEIHMLYLLYQTFIYWSTWIHYTWQCTALHDHTVPDNVLLYLTQSTWQCAALHDFTTPDNVLLYLTTQWQYLTILYLTVLLFYLTTLYLRVYWSTWQCTALPDYTVSDTVLLYQISLVRHISLVRCCADIVRTYISRDICPHYILLRFSPLMSSQPWYHNHVITTMLQNSEVTGWTIKVVCECGYE